MLIMGKNDVLILTILIKKRCINCVCFTGPETIYFRFLQDLKVVQPLM
ncbi:hypothetical protein KSE1242_22610 (plasmid) [Staphylococcus epidermidis]